MKIRMNMIVAVIITFCFTASFFMIIPIRSANQPYNPWIDHDENGAIGLSDLGMLANSYGMTGDPTKNVNITNWPTAQLHNYTDAQEYTVLDVGRMVNGTEYGICVISCGGFFAFTPKGNFLRVTSLTYTLEAHKDMPGFHTHDYTLSINYHDAEADHLELIDYYPTSRCQRADPTWVKPGVNLVGLQFYEYMFVMKLVVYVEYQYQA